MAALALRLARLGHVKAVRVDTAGGEEAAAAVRLVLAALATPGDAISPADGSVAVPGPPQASVSV